MAKKSYEKSKFMEALSEAPFILYAAKKSGISRATIYRWMKSDKDFKDKVDESMDAGHRNFTDLAEMTLMKKIKEGDMGAVKFFLSRRDPRYGREALPPPLTECGECRRNRPISPEQLAGISKAFEAWSTPVQMRKIERQSLPSTVHTTTAIIIPVAENKKSGAPLPAVTNASIVETE